MNQEGAQKIALTTQDLPTMPHIASKAMHRLSDPEASARDLQEIIFNEKVITAGILRIVNFSEEIVEAIGKHHYP